MAESKHVNMKDKYAVDKIHFHIRSAINSVMAQRNISYFKDIIVLCVGTDRSTGDCLGPLVGTLISERYHTGFHIYGTLSAPVHAINLKDTLTTINKNHDLKTSLLIAVDACLGSPESIGNIVIKDAALQPGSGIGKDLPPVGDISITGIVNFSGWLDSFVLQNTRMSIVYYMAVTISESLYKNAISMNNNTRIEDIL